MAEKIKNIARITGRLVLRVGAAEVDLGAISIPVDIDFVQDAQLRLKADIGAVREVVQAAFPTRGD